MFEKEGTVLNRQDVAVSFLFGQGRKVLQEACEDGVSLVADCLVMTNIIRAHLFSLTSASRHDSQVASPEGGCLILDMKANLSYTSEVDALFISLRGATVFILLNAMLGKEENVTVIASSGIERLLMLSKEGRSRQEVIGLRDFCLLGYVKVLEGLGVDIL